MQFNQLSLGCIRGSFFVDAFFEQTGVDSSLIFNII